MRLDVPYFKQSNELNCGPTAVKMVLAYFGNDQNIEVLEEKTGINQGKSVTTIQLATAAALLGYKSDFYSKNILFNEENLKFAYYQKFNDMDLEQSKKWVTQARLAGVNVEEKTVTLETITSLITPNSVPIILLDWSVVVGKEEKGYTGHFVPVVGYDDENIYVHDQGFVEPTAFKMIKREIFEKARKSPGTDEDIVVIYKN